MELIRKGFVEENFEQSFERQGLMEKRQQSIWFGDMACLKCLEIE